jgi:hypothetical protein
VLLEASRSTQAGGVFGKTGQPSGIFNTYVIPFKSSIRITVELSGDAFGKGLADAATAGAPNATNGATQRFWIIVRGHMLHTPADEIALPGTGMTLPPAAKLRTHENNVS